MNFRKGQKVVCVNDEWTPDREARGLPTPVKGSVYTVSETCIEPDNGNLFFIGLHEFPHAIGHLFAASHFRPAVEPGMEILNAILVNTKPPVNAPVREDA